MVKVAKRSINNPFFIAKITVFALMSSVFLLSAQNFDKILINNGILAKKTASIFN